MQIANKANIGNPLFSILIPVYNVEDYIKDCLNSVLSQETKEYEVILVDDGSTDHSGLICDEYCKKYPDVFRVIHKPNGGLIGARRVGIEKAIGQYCVFLDSDDMLKGECLSVLKECISKRQYDMVIYNYSYYIQETKLCKGTQPIFSNDEVFEGDGKKQLYLHLALDCRLNNLFIKMIKRSILQSDPTDYSLYDRSSFGEDLLQSLYPVTVSDSIAYLNKSLYLYRIHKNSMIHRFDKNTMWHRYRGPVYDEVIRYMHIWGIDTKSNIERREANSIVIIVGTIANHLKHTEETNSVVEFANEFVSVHNRSIKKAIIAKSVPLKKKIPIFLFSLKRYRLLTAYYCIAEKILDLRNKRS